MALYLVGENIDAKQAHLKAHAGELISLVRGVYVDAGSDVEATILGHAARIAHYLYPRAYLSAASAIAVGPTSDGRLFISGRRNQRTRLRSLEIIQNEAPSNPSIVPITIGDDWGELRLNASSPRQRFLEAFRTRSAHASAISETMRAAMEKRLIDEYGSPEGVADALWSLARENGWYREGEAAERYLKRQRGSAEPPANKAALDLWVAWCGHAIGRIRHDGYEWRWTPAKRSGPVLVRETTPGKLPPFIESLLPEGWLAKILQEKDERDALRHGKRYTSNIAIIRDKAELKDLPPDILHGRLETFQKGGVFTGVYGGPGRDHFEQSFEQNLAKLFARSETPRLSGIQIKAPMFLSDEGLLRPAITEPFTHIMKPAGTAGFEMLPVVEWFCLELGRAAGFEPPATALIPMPDGMPPALLVERFDIRTNETDQRMLALEDFCSILDLPTSAKYEGSIERIGRGLRPLSTDPQADLEILIRRALFAWLIADGDMHLKNVAMLKIADARAKTFRSVRFAPLYDAVTTRVFPGLAGDLMALPINGKANKLSPKDFEQLARTLEVPLGLASEVLDDLARRASAAIEAIDLPDIVSSGSAALAVTAQIRDIVRERARAFSRN